MNFDDRALRRNGSPAEGWSSVPEGFVIGPEYAIVPGLCRSSKAELLELLSVTKRGMRVSQYLQHGVSYDLMNSASMRDGNVFPHENDPRSQAPHSTQVRSLCD